MPKFTPSRSKDITIYGVEELPAPPEIPWALPLALLLLLLAVRKKE